MGLFRQSMADQECSRFSMAVGICLEAIGVNALKEELILFGKDSLPKEMPDALHEDLSKSIATKIFDRVTDQVTAFMEQDAAHLLNTVRPLVKAMIEQAKKEAKDAGQ
jgi:hypothetical protein